MRLIIPIKTGRNHRAHTEWQWPISEIHPIMMEKSAWLWWGWGVHAHPLSLYWPSRTKLQCTLQLRGQIHSPFHLYSYMCSVDATWKKPNDIKKYIYLKSSILERLNSRKEQHTEVDLHLKNIIVKKFYTALKSNRIFLHTGKHIEYKVYQIYQIKTSGNTSVRYSKYMPK